MGENYVSYAESLKSLDQENLDTRRYKQCLKFAKKISKDQRYQDKFIKTSQKTRPKNNYVVHEPKYRTTRYNKSAIPYLIRLLNKKT